MITLRQHIITLVAVFLALAVGVVLGSGPLADITDDVTPTAATSAPTSDEGDPFGESFATATGPTLVSGRLTDRQVALVTAGGADEQVVTALTDLVGAAGGAVTGRWAVSEAMLDPSQKTLVDTLGSQLMTQLGDDVPAAASTYDRMGQLLGLSMATRTPEGANFNGKARAVAEAITGADLVTSEAEPGQRAPLVLFVLGTDANDAAVDAILAGLTAGLAQQAVGVVLVGTSDDGGDGQLGRLRADPAGAAVATVDGSERAAGRVATVLALAKVVTSPGGSFGASGADGPAPLG